MSWRYLRVNHALRHASLDCGGRWGQLHWIAKARIWIWNWLSWRWWQIRRISRRLKKAESQSNARRIK